MLLEPVARMVTTDGAPHLRSISCSDAVQTVYTLKYKS